MRLTELFIGSKQSTEAGKNQSVSVAQNSLINRQIRALMPGQTISGEVLSKNGSEVQIRLAEDLVISARVDGGMNLELGKNIFFEVRNNGSALTLSPLFSNMATDTNVLKALDMSGLPINSTTVHMTESMMNVGLSVDKGSMQQLFREINSFPQAELENILDLHKLKLPVTEENLTQIASYKNLTHQLTEGMNQVFQSLTDTLQNMVTEGNVREAAGLYQELLNLVMNEVTGESVGTMERLPDEGLMNMQTAEVQQGVDVFPQTMQQSQIMQQQGVVTELGSVTETGIVIDNEALPQQIDVDISSQQTVPEQGIVREPRVTIQQIDMSSQQTVSEQGIVREPGVTIQKIDMSSQQTVPEQGIVREQGVEIQQIAVTVQQTVAEQNVIQQAINTLLTQHDITSDGMEQNTENAVSNGMRPEGEAQAMLSGALESILLNEPETVTTNTALLKQILSQALMQGDDELLKSVLGNKEVQKFLTDRMQEQWLITPEEVADEGKVDELYQRLNRQLKGIMNAFENAEQTSQAAYRTTTNLSNNIDFLHQFNQMYTYVQLPLKLQQGQAHGDLYVYTNKKNLAAKEGQISALLHLDMEHLGPVDVYVAMNAQKVNTKFYVQDDAMLDFLEGHMDLLTARLNKRGYDCSFDMQVRNSEDKLNSGIHPVLEQQGSVPLVQYAFDMRA